ncbi:hypothetical protein RHS04_00573 [Rhizoctonia solani]|uniref:Uncharacterized protein n=2 Tax=Rhizoctonia solani TaxID=456999 RepID=A0A8H7M1C3_9AGAM|nr:hypothetical protein RHS04_00573 [Rhizoctonia solani]KAF8754985.1 hypothetical protein RHS01_05571 [Rhizoctonia solani]
MPAFSRQEQHRMRQEREHLEAQKRKAERIQAHERRMRKQAEDAARAKADRARRHQERVADETRRRREKDARYPRSSSAQSNYAEYDYSYGAHNQQQFQHDSSTSATATRDAIRRYTAGLGRMNRVAVACDEQLSFTDIPWPTLYPICGTYGISKESVRHIVLSELLYPWKDRRGRLLAFLRYWHPDKFVGRWMQHIRESDRAAVYEGVTMVAGIANDLLFEHR